MGYIGQAPANKAVKTADIEDSAITAAKIADGTVVAGELASDSVTTAKILNANVTTAKLAADAVDGTKLADDAVNSEHYTDGSIDTAHINDLNVTTGKLAADAVTAAKLADDAVVTANIVDVNVTEAKIADNAITLAKMASGTDGNIISYDASGNPVAIATGNDGQVLTSAGAGQPPAFEAAAGGGKVLQVVQGSASSGTQTTTSNSWQTYANVTCTITPAASSSKILLWASQFNANGGNYVFMDFRREISGGASTNNISGATYGISWHQDSANVEHSHMMTYLDSPSTTSAITYKMNFRNDNNSDTIQLGQNLFQVIIAMEIGA